MANRIPKLTRRAVEALKANGADTVYWDGELTGFGIRVRKSGRKNYVLQTRVRGTLRWYTIGQHGRITADEARAAALEILAQAKMGIDPRDADARRKAEPVMTELGRRFLEEYVPVHCKPSTQGEYRRSVTLFIDPAIGEMRISEVKLHFDMRDKPYRHSASSPRPDAIPAARRANKRERLSPSACARAHTVAAFPAADGCRLEACSNAVCLRRPVFTTFDTGMRSGQRFNPDRRGTGHREHRRESHPQAWLMILSHIAPRPCPNGTRPAFLPPPIDSVMFRTSEHCAPGSAKLADIGPGQPGPMFVCGGPSPQSSRT